MIDIVGKFKGLFVHEDGRFNMGGIGGAVLAAVGAGIAGLPLMAVAGLSLAGSVVGDQVAKRLPPGVVTPEEAGAPMMAQADARQHAAEPLVSMPQGIPTQPVKSSNQSRLG